MFVRKILASDLKEAFFSMNGLLGASVVELLLKTMESDGIQLGGGDVSSYTFEEINETLTAIFGQATPLVKSQLERYLFAEKN